MTPFQRKPAKPQSKISQFVRFLMLGLCTGVGLAILSVSVVSPIMMRYSMNGIQAPNLAVTILFQLLGWADVLLLAPAAAYLAGRIFLSHKWKFVFSMFVGLKFFSFGLILIDVVPLTQLDILLDGTALILGFSLSIITFGRGVKAGNASSEKKADSPAAAAPEGAAKGKEILVPQTLSQIDFSAVAAKLNQEAEANGEKSSAPAGSAAPESAEVPALGDASGADAGAEGHEAEADGTDAAAQQESVAAPAEASPEAPSAGSTES